MLNEDVLYAFVILENAGIRPPDGFRVPDERLRAQNVQGIAAAYADVLEGASRSDLLFAVRSRLRQGIPFWPAAGELYVLLPHEQRRAVEDDGTEAWSKVRRWCRDHGRRTDGLGYREPRIGELDAENTERDRLMREALADVGGARAVCMSREDAEPHEARRFREAYRMRQKRVHVEDGLSRRSLTGSSLGALTENLLLPPDRPIKR